MNLVEVDYEMLPTVLSWRDAMAEGATLLHDDMTTYFRQERFAPRRRYRRQEQRGRPHPA